MNKDLSKIKHTDESSFKVALEKAVKVNIKVLILSINYIYIFKESVTMLFMI